MRRCDGFGSYREQGQKTRQDMDSCVEAYPTQ